MLYSCEMNEKYETPDASCGGFESCFYGTSTLGERGQVVIPSEARQELGLEAGDKLLIMRHPVHKGLMVFKLEAVREFLEDFGRAVNEIEKLEANS